MIDKILYIDDGLGAIISSEDFKNCFAADYSLIIDNVNFPYSLKYKIKKLLARYKNLGEYDCIITTNPAIALNIDDENLILNFKNFHEELKDGDLVITNNYFKKHLEDKNKAIRVVDGQVLSNQVQIFTTPSYIVDNILKSYIKDEKNIYFMDTNFYIVKDFILKNYPNRNIVFIQDIIKDELLGKKSSVFREDLKIYLTGYRRGVYLSLEDKYKRSFIDIKEINF